jgi:catechol 2,3-dioxygenase-like lactoylglutathione lyase family enzyme
MRVKPGNVGHFGVAVRDVGRAATWWLKHFDLRKRFSFPGGMVIGTEAFDIVLFKGTPRPEVIDHMSFHLPSMAALRAALAALKKGGVALEDPGDEIGPEGPGSPNMGLWFHDPDGYRWELSVLAKTPKRKAAHRRRKRPSRRRTSRAS